MSIGSLNSAGVSMADSDSHHKLDMAFDPNTFITPKERKEQALQVLKSDLLEKLNKEVRSLDEDSWMFEGPRSRIQLISRPGVARWSTRQAHKYFST